MTDRITTLALAAAAALSIGATCVAFRGPVQIPQPAWVETARLGSLTRDDSVVVGVSLSERDPTVGLTNSTVYASGTSATFLTEHQDLSFTNSFALKADVPDIRGAAFDFSATDRTEAAFANLTNLIIRLGGTVVR